MAYKFQFGPATLSGSTTFEEALSTESTLSSSGVASLLSVTTDKITAVDCNIDGGAIDGTTLGATTQSSVKATTLSASSTLNVAGASNFGAGNLASISAAGVLSGSGVSTLYGVTTDALIAQTVDINGGAVDGAIIGANSAVAGTFSVLSATSLGSAIDCDNRELTNIDIDSGAIDGTTLGATSQSSVKATTLSASSTLNVVGVSTFGENFASISAAGVLSGSGVSTLYGVTTDALIAQTADINGGSVDGAIIGANSAVAGTFSVLSATSLGSAIDCDNQELTNIDIDSGAIDGTTLGATSQSSVKATTLSASSTLHVAGASNFGTEAQTTVSAVGVLSSSANATINRITVPTLVGDMSGSGGLDLMGAASFGNARLVVNENIILGTTDLHVSGNFFKENALVAGDLAVNQSRIAYFDMKGGDMKTCDFKVYADVLAGTGITATAGVLSVDTTGGDSMSSKVINYIQAANDGYVLQAGMNFFVDTVTGSTNLQMPSGSSGDVVIVKTAIGVSTTNFVKVSSSLANAHQIDGFSEARIESAYGAVSFIYTQSGGATGDWVIY